MLVQLSISKYVLIDSLDLTFEDGLTIISGETGAGKSILLGALGLLLGERADTSAISPGSTKCIIEGRFAHLDERLKEIFEDCDLDFDPTECIIRREISARGKSRAFVNDTPTSLSCLKLLAEYLIDVHSQHKNLLLGDAGFQLMVLDLLAENQELLREYRTYYKDYQEATARLALLRGKSAEMARETDYLTYQFNELTEAALIDGEEQDLEDEYRILSHAQEIRQRLATAIAILSDEEHSPSSSIHRTAGEIHAIEQYLPTANELHERLVSVRIELDDVAKEIEQEAEALTIDPDRLDYVEKRLDLLNTLLHKHSVSDVASLISIREDINRQLQQEESMDAEISMLQQRIEKLFEQIVAHADTLHERREEAASELAPYLVSALQPLGMPDVSFSVRLEKTKEPTSSGSDRAIFLFSANKHIPPEPVAEIASGGETARLMLTIKALIAGRRALPTIIFDEIDTGLSGDVAERMGHIMQEMAKRMQVIAITHLPQIAACGKSHYYVHKETGEERTETKVRMLDKQERTNEIARMQSGSKLSDVSLAAARALLERSQTT